MTTPLLTTPDQGPNGQIKRDRWGRYMLPDPTTGEEKSWTRVTTLAGTLADRYGLEKWAQRNIVWGLGQRQDLYARAAATTLDDKQTLTRIVEEAQSAAADKAGANFGSAIHQFTERIDRGETVNVPAPYDKDIAAYQRELEAADIAVVLGWVERVVIIPDMEVVGTLDRLVDGQWSPQPRVADVKTGKDVVNFGMTEIALQLALYAHASHWWDGQQWHPMPLVDQDKAVVMHLPVGQGHCTLYEVDIAAGWDAVQLAADVRRWRKRKDLAQQIVPVHTPNPAVHTGPGPEAADTPVAGQVSAAKATNDTDAEFNLKLADHFGLEIPEGIPGHKPPLSAARVQWIRTRVERIKELGIGDVLADIWSRHPDIPTFPKGGPTTNHHIDIISQMCDEAEKALEAPFGPSDPTKPYPTSIKKETKTP